MTSVLAAPFMQLAAGEVSSGVGAVSCNLRVLAGCVWITVEGDTRDYWLGAGDSLRIPPGRLVVVEAHRLPASFRVVPCMRHPLPPQFHSTIGREIQHACSND